MDRAPESARPAAEGAGRSGGGDGGIISGTAGGPGETGDSAAGRLPVRSRALVSVTNTSSRL
ncbi:MAG: hypothetical protein ACM3U2_14810, partial [Deltaproteobacteria bacterium]